MSNDSSGERQLAEQVRRLLQSIEASGRTVLPSSNNALLQSIVDAAARIFGAPAASIALADEQKQVLKSKLAYGACNSDVVGMGVPIVKGLAGYVAASGQHIAIRSVQQGARFKLDFAQSTGCVPHSILATPLVSEDRVVGVMEVLTKINAPSFGIQDMELLGMFAL